MGNCSPRAGNVVAGVSLRLWGEVMRKFLLGTCLAVFAFNADAQPKDCKGIADPAERLKCFDQPRDCKSISDTADRLKCFDSHSADAQETPLLQILKIEPAVGQLPAGAKVLIDDGSCPAGKIKQVVGGNTTIGQARMRSCVPRP
jgi:hypothetical protein